MTETPPESSKKRKGSEQIAPSDPTGKKARTEALSQAVEFGALDLLAEAASRLTTESAPPTPSEVEDLTILSTLAADASRVIDSAPSASSSSTSSSSSDAAAMDLTPDTSSASTSRKRPRPIKDTPRLYDAIAELLLFSKSKSLLSRSKHNVEKAFISILHNTLTSFAKKRPDIAGLEEIAVLGLQQPNRLTKDTLRELLCFVTEADIQKIINLRAPKKKVERHPTLKKIAEYKYVDLSTDMALHCQDICMASSPVENVNIVTLVKSSSTLIAYWYDQHQTPVEVEEHLIKGDKAKEIIAFYQQKDAYAKDKETWLNHMLSLCFNQSYARRKNKVLFQIWNAIFCFQRSHPTSIATLSEAALNNLKIATEIPSEASQSRDSEVADEKSSTGLQGDSSRTIKKSKKKKSAQDMSAEDAVYQKIAFVFSADPKDKPKSTIIKNRIALFEKLFAKLLHHHSYPQVPARDITFNTAGLIQKLRPEIIPALIKALNLKHIEHILPNKRKSKKVKAKSVAVEAVAVEAIEIISLSISQTVLYISILI